jgi:hypothetical protein
LPRLPLLTRRFLRRRDKLRLYRRKLPKIDDSGKPFLLLQA